jgi:HEAT repeat protein
LNAAIRKEDDAGIKPFMELALFCIGDADDDMDTIFYNIGNKTGPAKYIEFKKLVRLNSSERRKAATVLARMLEAGEENDRDMILMTLGDFGKDAEPASNAICKLLKESIERGYPDEEQYPIVSALTNIGNADSAPLLVEVLKKGNKNCSNAAYLALKNTGPDLRVVFTELVEIAKLGSRNSDISRDAIFLIGDIGKLNEKEASVLAELLESDDIAMEISCTLYKNGGKLAVPALIKKLESEKPLTRRVASNCLTKAGKDDERAIAAIKTALAKEKDEDIKKIFEADLKEISSEQD